MAVVTAIGAADGGGLERCACGAPLPDRSPGSPEVRRCQDCWAEDPVNARWRDPGRDRRR